MIRPSPKTLDDIASLAGGAVNMLSGLRLQIKNEIAARMDEALTKMNAVPREEHEQLEATVRELQKRIEKLEK